MHMLVKFHQDRMNRTREIAEIRRSQCISRMSRYIYIYIYIYVLFTVGRILNRLTWNLEYRFLILNKKWVLVGFVHRWVWIFFVVAGDRTRDSRACSPTWYHYTKRTSLRRLKFRRSFSFLFLTNGRRLPLLRPAYKFEEFSNILVDVFFARRQAEYSDWRNRKRKGIGTRWNSKWKLAE